jgi:hypothetical protein
MNINAYKRAMTATQNTELARMVAYKCSEVAYLEACRPKDLQNQELIIESMEVVRMIELFLRARGV